MIFGLKCKLMIPNAYSLKEKRRILSSLLTRGRQKFEISVCELGEHELYNMTVIEAAYCGNDGRIIENNLREFLRWIEENYPVEIIEVEWSQV